jgi:hypothetical protein
MHGRHRAHLVLQGAECGVGAVLLPERVIGGLVVQLAQLIAARGDAPSQSAPSPQGTMWMGRVRAQVADAPARRVIDLLLEVAQLRQGKRADQSGAHATAESSRTHIGAGAELGIHRLAVNSCTHETEHEKMRDNEPSGSVCRRVHTDTHQCQRSNWERERLAETGAQAE